MKNKLWVAMVDHEEVPGTKLQFFFQETEPTAGEIFPLFAQDVDEEEDPMEVLMVTGMFDVTHELQHRGNLATFLAAAKQMEESISAQGVQNG